MQKQSNTGGSTAEQKSSTRDLTAVHSMPCTNQQIALIVLDHYAKFGVFGQEKENLSLAVRKGGHGH